MGAAIGLGGAGGAAEVIPHSSRVVSFSEALAASPLGNGSRQRGGTGRLLIIGKKKFCQVFFFCFFYYYFLFFCLFFGVFCFLKEKYSEDTRKRIKERKREETLGEKALPSTSIPTRV